MYVTVADVNDTVKRNEISDKLYTIIAAHVSNFNDCLCNQKYVKKISYSSTVPVTELVYAKNDTHIKINYVVKSANATSGVNNVRNSDITELLPVLLFYKYAHDTQCVPDEPTEDFVHIVSDILEELISNNSDLIPAGYHEARYRCLFSDVVHDELAMKKVRAGCRLYKFLVERFGHALAKITIVAHTTGYDTVADINCVLHDNSIIPVSIKSYSSLSSAIKIKSLAWHRLIYNNLSKERMLSPSLPAVYSITDTQTETTASHNLLEQLYSNLTNDYRVNSSSPSTVDILCLCIISNQTDTLVIDTITQTDDIVYHKELNKNTINTTTFAGCTLDNNVLKVRFGDLSFSIVIRFRHRYPTIDIYYNYTHEKYK